MQFFSYFVMSMESGYTHILGAVDILDSKIYISLHVNFVVLDVVFIFVHRLH